jgi:L-ascorbate metabolism protein UlaG (beta-lactamase superfamily)
MVPIGGRKVHNIMDEKEALGAVKIMSPKMVIPCHYDCGALLSRKLNQADANMFKHYVEKMGIGYTIMKYGDELIV